MSIWVRIKAALAALARGEPLSRVFDHLRTPPEQTAAFAIAVIALGAKIAKADGHVSRDEVRAFRRIFHIPPEDEDKAARVFDLARQDVAGFEEYARKIRRMFEGREDPPYCDLLEGLYQIAIADGEIGPPEEEFIARVAEIWGVDERRLAALRARFTPGEGPDPYTVLGVSPEAPFEEIRRAWRRLVRECHPDQLIARGVPEEARKLAERRMQDINRAWEEISRRHARRTPA